MPLISVLVLEKMILKNGMSRYRIRVAKISKIFLRCVGLLDIPDTYEGERYMLVPSLRMKKNESTTYGKLKFHSSSLA